MRVGSGITALFCICHLLPGVIGQCTFGATFANTDWYDNTKGTLEFTATGMTGWSFNSIRTVGTISRDAWQCVNHTDDTFLVLRTTTTFSFQPLSSTNTIQVYAYLCLQLTKITANSFMYYQKQVQEINLGGERLKVSTSPTLYQGDVCDTSVTVPTTEYHVLVKSGSEASAAIQCPNSLLFTVDFIFYYNNGNAIAIECAGAGDRWDVCTNKSEMAITTSSCTQEIMFSAGGNFYCVATISANGYDYTTVYNRDATFTGTTNRFACLSSSGNDISVAPGNCTAFQTPFSFPLEADQITPTGHRLVVQDVIVNCGPSSGLTAGEIAAIVISVLFIVYVWTLTVLYFILVSLIAIICCQLGIACVAEFTSYGDHIPRKKIEVPLKLNIPDVEKEKLAATLEAVVITSPSNVILNGKANGNLTTEKEKSDIHGKGDKKYTKAFKSPGRKKDE